MLPSKRCSQREHPLYPVLLVQLGLGSHGVRAGTNLAVRTVIHDQTVSGGKRGIRLHRWTLRKASDDGRTGLPVQFPSCPLTTMSSCEFSTSADTAYQRLPVELVLDILVHAAAVGLHSDRPWAVSLLRVSSDVYGHLKPVIHRYMVMTRANIASVLSISRDPRSAHVFGSVRRLVITFQVRLGRVGAFCLPRRGQIVVRGRKNYPSALQILSDSGRSFSYRHGLTWSERIPTSTSRGPLHDFLHDRQGQMP
ncbi:hypothetical protein EXIGLDRAFT_431657 [Exidia glandulosa HHB12029]|uniref:Uncharacterized protein n=1 Tax=Exidia glandulosa HHB12029 TaxID=1314781 RepID=A0A165KGX1_EXIGL|nr:hypothetical protein EXIGLDRAFT_431657 [Exidia glandulosa HHB12029]